MSRLFACKISAI